MHSGIVAIENRELQKECAKILSTFPSIDVKFIDSLNTLNDDLTFSALFLIINHLNEANPKKIESIQKKFPKFPIILYNHSLLLSKNSHPILQNNLYFVVGVERHRHLENLIRMLLKNHWRKIPYKKLGIDFENLSDRMKQVMEYIESNDLQSCDIEHLARYLKITPGYFSQIFKSETGQSFRRFMQKLINYYEDLLFLDWGLDVKNVSRLLGYSELASFSRSFKNRKGQSPRAFTKLHVHS